MKKSISPLRKHEAIKSINMMKSTQNQTINNIGPGPNFIKSGPNVIASNMMWQNSVCDNTQNLDRYNYLVDGTLQGKAISLNNHNITNDLDNIKKSLPIGVSQQKSISPRRTATQDKIFNMKTSNSPQIKEEVNFQIKVAKMNTTETLVTEYTLDTQITENKPAWNIQNSPPSQGLRLLYRM